MPRDGGIRYGHCAACSSDCSDPDSVPAPACSAERPASCTRPVITAQMPPRCATFTTCFCEARARIASPRALDAKPITVQHAHGLDIHALLLLVRAAPSALRLHKAEVVRAPPDRLQMLEDGLHQQLRFGSTNVGEVFHIGLVKSIIASSRLGAGEHADGVHLAIAEVHQMPARRGFVHATHDVDHRLLGYPRERLSHTAVQAQAGEPRLFRGCQHPRRRSRT